MDSKLEVLVLEWCFLPGGLLEMSICTHTPALRNSGGGGQQLVCEQASRWFICVPTFENHCLRARWEFLKYSAWPIGPLALKVLGNN